MSPSLLDALDAVGEFAAGGRPSPAGGNDGTVVPRAAPRRGGRKPVSEMTEQEIVDMNNRALGAIQAKMPSFKIG